MGGQGEKLNQPGNILTSHVQVQVSEVEMIKVLKVLLGAPAQTQSGGTSSHHSLKLVEMQIGSQKHQPSTRTVLVEKMYERGWITKSRAL